MKAKFLQLLVTVLFMAVQFSAAASTQYPSQPIRLVVPAGVGGITDLLARALAERLAGILGQPVVVENRAGASGVIGTSQVVRAKPDGYTLLMVFPSHVANPTTIKDLPYDTVNDLEPIAKVGKVAEILLVNNTGPYKTIEDIIQAALAEPGKLNYGSVGAGSLGHLSTVVFADRTNIQMTNIAYKSEPEVVIALMRGDLDLAFVSPPAAIPMIEGEKVTALAQSDAQRLPMLPDVATVAEAAKLPNYTVTGWNAIFAPKGTPEPILKKLNEAINTALKDPKLVESFLALGVPALGGSIEELRTSLVNDIEEIRSTLKTIGFEPD